MDMKPEPRVLYCDCAYAAALSPQVKQEVRRALDESGLGYDAVSDLCELAGRKAPLLADLAGASRLAIAACHQRAVRWLFAAGGAPLPEAGVSYLDMREGATEELLRAIRDLVPTPGKAAAPAGHSAVPLPRSGSDAAASTDDPEPATPAWSPWFPVIDYERCENCQQCLGFCLFGVYGVGPDGTVQAQNPTKCKTGCPACARVCPSAAIIFPKYPNAPINGGEPKEGDPVMEPVKVDRAMLLRGDTLKILQDRGKNVLLFSRTSDEFKALQERMLHLAGSHRPLDILPAESSSKPPTEEPA
jgi:NAD-dependent dihydropyrimidine dehydrogenase PreA subunit